MAGSSAANLPVQDDWIVRKFEELDVRLRELQPSVAKSVSDIVNDLRAELPTGTVVPYAGASAPTGWLLCDNTLHDPADHPALFALIGTTYGGDGVTTFGVPNLKGRVAVGIDPGDSSFDALGEIGGAKTHTLTTAEMPSHTHTQDSHNHSYTDSSVLSGTNATLSAGPTFVHTGATSNVGKTTGSETATNQNTGGGGAHNNLQPYIALNYIIKAIGV